MAAVNNLCTKAVMLKNGQIVSMGATSDVVEYYLSAGATAPMR